MFLGCDWNEVHPKHDNPASGFTSKQRISNYGTNPAFPIIALPLLLLLTSTTTTTTTTTATKYYHRHHQNSRSLPVRFAYLRLLNSPPARSCHEPEDSPRGATRTVRSDASGAAHGCLDPGHWGTSGSGTNG